MRSVDRIIAKNTTCAVPFVSVSVCECVTAIDGYVELIPPVYQKPISVCESCDRPFSFADIY